MIECKICGKEPFQIERYLLAVADKEISPAEYVKHNEDTYNKKTGLFLCDNCQKENHLIRA